ncbi:MAG: TraR/DksA C4-type zinc finger protein [Deltaproteobacteria bacterium]|nr:TraR/DksA C4-type zinc finger protein [Deltaproteobacteria bacterium]
MKPEVVQSYKNLLTQRIQDLLLSTGHVVQTMRDSNETMPDPCDQAFQEFFHTISFSLRDKDRQAIREIREVMKRIDEGTFGICRMCKKKISEKRLMAHPATTLCIDCKRREETLQLNHRTIPESFSAFDWNMEQ